MYFVTYVSVKLCRQGIMKQVWVNWKDDKQTEKGHMLPFYMPYWSCRVIFIKFFETNKHRNLKNMENDEKHEIEINRKILFYAEKKIFVIVKKSFPINHLLVDLYLKPGALFNLYVDFHHLFTYLILGIVFNNAYVWHFSVFEPYVLSSTEWVFSWLCEQ